MRGKAKLSILCSLLLLCFFSTIGWGDTIDSYLSRTGVLIMVDEVEEESPFYELLLAEDIIVYYDGILMQNIYAMVEYLSDKGGEEVYFLVERGGERVEVIASIPHPAPEIWGIDFQGIHNPYLTDEVFNKVYNEVILTLDEGDALFDDFLEGELTYRDFYNKANDIMTRFLLLSQFNAFTRDAWANIRDPERVLVNIYKYDVFISLLRAQFAANFLEILMEDEEVAALHKELVEINTDWSNLGITVKP